MKEPTSESSKQTPPKETTKPADKRDAVDYPVIGCPNCRDTNTFVLPPENQPTRAAKEGWRKRECRACHRQFKEALRR